MIIMLSKSQGRYVELGKKCLKLLRRSSIPPKSKKHSIIGKKKQRRLLLPQKLICSDLVTPAK